MQEASISANGARFHCVSEGEGPLVLLLHGFPERWFSWRHQLPYVAARGYRAVAPDLRGYGLSERTVDGYDLDNLARDVVGLIRALGYDTATVVGHDWGGALTWETVARHPTAVDRFAVLNCPHPAVFQDVLLRSPAQLRRSWYMFFFTLPWLPERVLSRNGGAAIARSLRGMAVDRSRFDRESLRPFAESLASPEALRGPLAYYRQAMKALLHPRESMRRRRSYGTIERPGLLLWAEEDRALGPELIAPHVNFVRDLHVRRVPRCGHFVQQEQPEVVNDALGWWLDATRHAVAS